jgi:hypothetical protein
MRPWIWGLFLLASDDARADDRRSSGEAAPIGVSMRARRWAPPDVPLLHLDAFSPLNAESSAVADHAMSRLDLGRGVRVTAEGTWRSSALTSPLSELDGTVRGWSAASELSYAVGPFRLGARAGAGYVDHRFERGSYRFAGVSVSRTFRLSRWMLAWISLGIGFKQWSGAPPPGESNGAALELTVGTTFR